MLQRVHRETKCNDENGRELEAMLVFTHSIRYLKDHLLKTICKGFIEDPFKISDINFVLTVPAIWDDTAKMFMREAAIKVILLKIYRYVFIHTKCTHSLLFLK